jgi:hypothetical protein
MKKFIIIALLIALSLQTAPLNASKDHKLLLNILSGVEGTCLDLVQDDQAVLCRVTL